MSLDVGSMLIESNLVDQSSCAIVRVMINQPLFKSGDMTATSTEIFEVLEVIPVKEEYSYKVALRAYLREHVIEEWENQIHSFETIIEESKLSKFDHKKPKYDFGQRLALGDLPCVARFIEFKNHHYVYHLMHDNHDHTISYGWIQEEDYISVR